jgi:hypothetical protein
MLYIIIRHKTAYAYIYNICELYLIKSNAPLPAYHLSTSTVFS